MLGGYLDYSGRLKAEAVRVDAALHIAWRGTQI